MPETLVASGKERFVEDIERLHGARSAKEPGSLSALRKQAGERFSALGFPTVKMEDWRFTNVAPIARSQFEMAGEGSTPGSGIDDLRFTGSRDAVLLNGRFSPDLSRLEGLQQGLVVTSMKEALESFPEKVEPYLGRLAAFEEHAFVALNTALFEDGIFIFVPRNVVVEEPINLIHLALPGERPIAFFPRILVVAEESSQITLVEQYATEGEGSYLGSPVTEIVAGANASVDHYKLQRESLEAFHAATFQIQLQRDSRVSSHSISWGGRLVRNDVNAVLDGEGCEATLNGLYMVEGKQLVDNHMRVEHAKPHCDSHELYKGILEDRSRAIFNGRIFVHKGAQKTDAKQTNRNLLMSKDAICNSNPQLEIFADDVKCTHGSTVGQLDETAIFYLRSRGISEEAARSLLTYAFAADIVERIAVEPLRRELEEFLFRRLPKGDIVRQAV